MVLYEIGKQIPLTNEKAVAERLGCVDHQGEYRVHRQAADDIDAAWKGEERRSNERPGRRSNDGGGAGWLTAVIIAFLAAMALAVPQEWKYAPPLMHTEVR